MGGRQGVWLLWQKTPEGPKERYHPPGPQVKLSAGWLQQGSRNLKTSEKPRYRVGGRLSRR